MACLPKHLTSINDIRNDDARSLLFPSYLHCTDTVPKKKAQCGVLSVLRHARACGAYESMLCREKCFIIILQAGECDPCKSVWTQFFLAQTKMSWRSLLTLQYSR